MNIREKGASSKFWYYVALVLTTFLFYYVYLLQTYINTTTVSTSFLYSFPKVYISYKNDQLQYLSVIIVELLFIM